MGQKVNPHGFRVGVIKDWDSRWFARSDKVGDLIVEDYNIRKYLKKTLFNAGIPKIEIERDNAKIRILIHCARPGVVIGKGGEAIEKLRVEMEKRLGKPVALSIVEVRNADTNAQLVAESIADKLEKRIGFRRAMKNAMGRAMRMGVRGIKVMVAGRLNGAEIARSEMYHEGTIPLQTLRADIEYGFAEAATTYGRIGVKVWIYNGEILNQTLRTTPRTMDTTKQPKDRRDRGDRRGGRGGYNRGGQGGYNRGGQTGGSTGGYNRGGQTGGSTGGYNRGGQTGGSTGGYNRGGQTGGSTGGYNRGGQTGGQGGYNRGGQTGGYNNNRTGQTGTPANRPASGGTSAPANRPATGGTSAPANRPATGGTPAPAPKEGGNS